MPSARTLVPPFPGCKRRYFRACPRKSSPRRPANGIRGAPEGRGELTAKPGSLLSTVARARWFPASRMLGAPSRTRRPAPADHLGVDALARFGAPPIVVPPMAEERQRIGADMILAENLKNLILRSFGVAGKRVQPGLSGCHFRLCLPRCDQSPSHGLRNLDARSTCSWMRASLAFLDLR